jgi:hypothetical protein
LLRAALVDRGVTSHGRSGLNVWIPVLDETVAITRLISAGWAAAPVGELRFGGHAILSIGERAEVPLVAAVADHEDVDDEDLVEARDFAIQLVEQVIHQVEKRLTFTAQGFT